MSEEKTTVPTSAIDRENLSLPNSDDLMAVVAHYQSPLLRYVSKLLGTIDHEAEDIVQETFVKLHLQVVKKENKSIRNLTTWLFKTAHNLSIDTFRRGVRRKKTLKTTQTVSLATEQAAEEMDALGEVLRREAREAAIRELSGLDEQIRQVVLLKIIQGMTLRQVAEVAGISTSLANYRLNKGLRELAQRLKKAGVV